MKIFTLILLISICSLTVFQSCHKKLINQTYCTLEYRTVSIQVIGDTLDDYYTIRQTSGDTIRINNINSIFENNYPVLDDNYQQHIENSTETFLFYGLINDSIVVREPFVIKADRCHIEYVSGRLQVNL